MLLSRRLIKLLYTRSPSSEDMNERHSRGIKPSLRRCRNVGALGDLGVLTSTSLPVPRDRITSGFVAKGHSLAHSQSARSIGLLCLRPPS